MTHTSPSITMPERTNTEVPHPARCSLTGARLQWLSGMLKEFAGEATGNVQLEIEGTVTKLLGRRKIEMLSHLRTEVEPKPNDTPEIVQPRYDVGLHERAARQLELAALHHRQAVRHFNDREEDRAHYHALLAQGFSGDAAHITRQIGRDLWRSMEAPR